MVMPRGRVDAAAWSRLGEVAEDLVLAQAAVVEDLDEGEDLGAGGSPVGPDPGADLLLEQGPDTLRGCVVET
jgi:hypothetical protein